MPITPLMLKKQPDIVTTIRKLRKYIGPQTEPSDPKVIDYIFVVKYLILQKIPKLGS